MKMVRMFSIALCAFSLVAVQACKKEVKVDSGATAVDTAAARMNNGAATVGTEIKTEGIEKKVEAKLIAEPGMGGITVSSTGDGIVVLTGTATENEKGKAQVIAQNTDGVKSVVNNVMVQK